MNILERVKAVEANQCLLRENEKIEKLHTRIERLEKIIESQGYYIP